MRINGHTLPSPSEDWSPFFEEVFFHTSRYFPARLNDLQKIAGLEQCCLQDFHAGELTDAQRFVLSWMMTASLDEAHVKQVLQVMERFHELDRSLH